MKKEKKFYWHIHHDILIEPLTEPVENRIKFIKGNKPEDEIELRLKLLKPVKGKLPTEFVEAWHKYDEASQKFDEVRQKLDEAWHKYDEAWQKLDEVRQKLVEAWQKYKPQLEALHKKECPNCPWTGSTIFGANPK